jgi:hypothetical protein
MPVTIRSSRNQLISEAQSELAEAFAKLVQIRSAACRRKLNGSLGDHDLERLMEWDAMVERAKARLQVLEEPEIDI